MVQVQGYFDLRFAALRDAFAELFNDPQQRGAALCVQVGGETVVDLWAGQTDKDGLEAWHSDTILNLFSCTKPFAAVTALQLVGEGPQFTENFAEAQRRLLGPGLFCANGEPGSDAQLDGTADLLEQLLERLLHDSSWMAALQQLGSERIGCGGGAARMAADLHTRLDG